MQYTIIHSNDYLAHHGILGQKWGKRNGPPYPIDAKDHSASEKKAGWQKSIDGHKYSRKEAAKLYRKRESYAGSKLDSLVKKNQKEFDRLDNIMGERTTSTTRDKDGNILSTTRIESDRSAKAANSYDELYEQLEDEALKWANNKMLKEYGNYAIKDIDKYTTQNGAIAVASLIGMMGVYLYAMSK